VIGGGASDYAQNLTFEPQTTWKSSDSKIASVTNNGETKGLASGLEIGTIDVEGKYILIKVTETLPAID